MPVVESQIVVLDTVTWLYGQGGPVSVEIERVSVGVAHEVCEAARVEGAAATVGLYHEHLIGVLCVDMVIGYVMDVRVRSQRTDRTSARPVAEDALDLYVASWAL